MPIGAVERVEHCAESLCGEIDQRIGLDRIEPTSPAASSIRLFLQDLPVEAAPVVAAILKQAVQPPGPITSNDLLFTKADGERSVFETDGDSKPG